MPEETKQWFKSNALTLLLIVFVAGGFYYDQKAEVGNIQLNTENIERTQRQVERNSLQIERIQAGYVSQKDLDDFVTRPILEDLEKLIREIQSNQNDRLDRIEERIDYLIKQER